jgi:hypothetical protein
MSDLIYLLVIVGFFALAAGLVRACEHIIGPDAVPASSSTTSSTSAEAVAAATPAEVTELCPTTARLADEWSGDRRRHSGVPTQIP